VGKLIIIAPIIIAVIVIAFTFSSCEKAEEEIAERVVKKPVESETVEETNDIDIDTDVGVDGTEGELKITGDDEEEINTGEADIPDGWPQEVPIHPDLEIISSNIFTQEGEKAFLVSAMYKKGSSLELFNWYKSKLSPSWEIVSEVSDSNEGGFFYSIRANTSLYDLYLTITEFEGEISVIINVGEE